MNYYLIKETLFPCGKEEIKNSGCQYAAVLSWKEWEENRDYFDLGIDMEMDHGFPKDTKAVVNIDSLTGSFNSPDLMYTHRPARGFSFALDEKGIILIDDSGYVLSMMEKIRVTRKWRLVGIERFLYDLLECAISEDLTMLERMEHRLTEMEEVIIAGTTSGFPPELNTIRGDLLDLRIHYEQLIDLSQELEENENGFFREEALRYFHMFTDRAIRLQAVVSGQREHVLQLMDLMQSSMDIQQNRIMALLTVVTSIFLPLTLIAGWYGMNFRYMPELEWKWGYFAVIFVSILIIIVSLIWFKKKKWL